MQARVTIVFEIEGLISLTQRQPLLIRTESSGKTPVTAMPKIAIS
jgi:hypothetical protein